MIPEGFTFHFFYPTNIPLSEKRVKIEPYIIQNQETLKAYIVACSVIYFYLNENF